MLVQRIGRDRVLLGGRRVAHRQLVLERRALEPPAADGAAGLRLRASQRATSEAWTFTAEFPNQDAVEPADWTKLEVPRLERRGDGRVVEGELAVLQRTVATLSPVEGRLARDDDVAVVDIVSEDGPGQKDYVVEVGTERLLPELEDSIKHLLPGDTDDVGLRAGRRDAAERRGHAEGAVRARPAAARRLARDVRIGVRHASTS